MPVVASMLNPPMNGPAGEYKNRPEGSTNSWLVGKNKKKGDPGIAVKSPVLALIVNPNRSPKSSDKYKNLPEGSTTVLVMEVFAPKPSTIGNLGSIVRDPVALSIFQASTLFVEGIPAYKKCPDGCAAR